jgi:arylsulfatase A-like enzyme
VANTVAGGLNGFDRGFSEFHELWRTHGSRADVFRQAIPEWLDAQGGRRFFAYLHFREPHSPYDPEPPFDTAFGPDGPIPKAARRPPGDAWIIEVNQGRRTLTAPERDHLVRLYDGNIAYADHEIGALRQALEARGLWDKTIVIIAADHGEGLLDHAWIGHNVQLYEESARVPLIVRFPPAAGVSPRRVAALSELLDVAPTIADLFGVQGEGGSDRAFAGRSLLPVIEGAPGKVAVLTRTIWDRPIYGRVDGMHKLVYDTRTGAQMLFDLKADPGERDDRAAAEPILAAFHRQALQETIARLSRRPVAATGDQPEMTRDQCENLKALGYLAAGTSCAKRPPASGSP